MAIILPNGHNYTNGNNYTKCPQNKYQIAITLTNLFPFRALKIAQIGISGFEIYHLATLLWTLPKRKRMD
jgi:hypothetical protein